MGPKFFYREVWEFCGQPTELFCIIEPENGGLYVIRIGPYDRKKASALKVKSGNFPGHGTIPAPPKGARTGYGLYDGGKWMGFVELTRPYKKQKVYSSKSAFVGVGISPKYRRQGLGEKAVSFLMKKHPEVKRWKWQYVHTNKGSRKLGNKMGFKNPVKHGIFENMEKTAGFRYGIYSGLRKLKIPGA